MDTAVTIMLFVTGFFCIAAGITVAKWFRVFPWLAGKVSRPRLWGTGYALFGAVVLYHAVVELVRVDPTLELVMTAVTTVVVFVALGMMWIARPGGPETHSPGPGATD
ncbi:hypothetical protein [Streptomyces fuscichromogenes]|uniref:Uncharacterized protein n=1 Tax=Streptomyces fuscichromogenes TaxID=1324013 RepID=A0A918CS34_9ACTN|nr:hypothetical protein [Streptomyces fuscichromogenes]GGN14982.1 hypothetical protein GCM10011578_042860 [Streptomyces fuscichromogenes]